MCVKFQVPSFHTFGDMLRTKIPEKNCTKGNNSKNTEDKVIVPVHCMPP